MGHTCNSIIINAPYEKVFDVSNDIDRWKELFDEYKESVITQREGNKITFRLTNQEGQSWQSWRLLFKDKKFCYAEREEPKFPFKYMKLVWLYRELAEGPPAGEAGTEMTWIQHFTMDEKAKFNDEQVEGFINKHSQDNLKRMKEIIEKEVK